MFLQVIRGRTNDAEGLKRQLDRWHDEIRPSATGYLGTTAGVAEDGTFFAAARFEDEQSARANSDRAEQGAWWNETAKYLDGEPAFTDYTDVQLTLGGGSNDAGFVQVMQGRVSDAGKVREFEREFMPKMSELRPDVLGSVRGWDGNAFTDVIYFTSEAEAREGERRMSEQPENASPEDVEAFGEYMALIEEVTYLDLKEPWLR